MSTSTCKRSRKKRRSDRLEERLQKLIAQSGLCSRRKAEELITEGRVRVNGKKVTTLGTKASSSDTITVDGKPVEPEEKVHYVFYKPEGCVSTARDDKGRRTVVDYLPKDRRLFPVGRLDYDASGVLLMTNDGDLTVSLTHPRYDIEKEYEVTLEGFVRKTTSKAIARGVELDGRMTKPAKIRDVVYDKKKARTRLRLVITEGKYHHIKELFASFDHPVVKLKRVRFGIITLDGLAKGEDRPLKIHELKRLRLLVEKAKNKTLR